LQHLIHTVPVPFEPRQISVLIIQQNGVAGNASRIQDVLYDPRKVRKGIAVLRDEIKRMRELAEAKRLRALLRHAIHVASRHDGTSCATCDAIAAALEKEETK